MKFENLRATWRYWLIGTVIAVVGVILARLVAPHYVGKTQTVLSSVGRLTSFVGLIASCLRRQQTHQERIQRQRKPLAAHVTGLSSAKNPAAPSMAGRCMNSPRCPRPT
ncbi:MAG: hypothetical protein IPP19_15915 [Verrucomicrobia bacterium]|nr:hypothetical protein [Verrucomicrobiota bacterium]